MSTIEHNLERGQCSVHLGGKRRLVWFKNQTRRKLEELNGKGLMSLDDQSSLGFDLITKMVRAGLSYRESVDGMPAEEDVDDWFDGLVTLADAEKPEWKEAIERGDAETFATLAKKVSEALAWSMTGRSPAEEAKEEPSEDRAGKESAAA